MNMPISKMSREIDELLSQGNALIDKLADASSVKLEGGSADGLLKITATANKEVEVFIHPGMISDDNLRDHVALSIEEAIIDLFFKKSTGDAETDQFLASIESSSNEVVSITQEEFRNQLTNINTYFDRFKARLHGVHNQP